MQRKVISEAKRFNVVCCGRRFGKSTLGIDRIAPYALSGKPTGWFAPTYKILLPTWREAVTLFDPAIIKKSEQEHRLEFIGGGCLEMWSFDSDVVTRGRAYASLVVDEAAVVKDLLTTWDTAVRPTLTDWEGGAWFLSTPRGMNDFNTLFKRGQDSTYSEWMSWQMPTNANPHISLKEIESARLEITEAAFQQEYLAQFVSWEGAVFRKISAAATAEELDGPLPDHLYVIGADWGKTRDYTVFIVLDITTRSVVYMERSNTVDYIIQRDRLSVLNQKWRPIKIIAEQNSIGVPIIEELQRPHKNGAGMIPGMPIQPFLTTNATKAVAVEALSLAFEQESIKILNNPVLLGELQAFQSKKTPSGLIQYSAPEGQHDDCVIALALAWQGVAEHRLFPEFDTSVHVVAA